MQTGAALRLGGWGFSSLALLHDLGAVRLEIAEPGHLAGVVVRRPSQGVDGEILKVGGKRAKQPGQLGGHGGAEVVD